MKYPLYLPFPPSLSFAGQNVLITGGNSGLGLEAAIHYVKLGASVIITTRNEARGNEALAAITARTGKKDAVRVRILDMDTFKGVTTFVDGLKRDVKAIDIVLLNAGLSNLGYKKSPEGWESNLQTNVLSTTLAALLMLPWMRSVKEPGKKQHLGFVGSGTQTDVDILAKSFPKEDVLSYWSDTKNYRARPEAYFRSKLFLEYAIREITKLSVVPRGRPSPIINSVCPGPVVTNLAREFSSKGFLGRTLVSVGLYFLGANPVEPSSRALVMVATTSEEENGKFLRHYWTDAEYNALAAKNITNPEGKKMQAEVWREIVGILEAAVPEVSGIVSGKALL